MSNQHNSFDVAHTLHELRHYLPSQTPLKDFIHHNSLHAFQHLSFYEGIFQAASIFGYQVTIPLNEFRKMYASGRIRLEILERLVLDKKGVENAAVWMENLLRKPYDSTLKPRIGRLRAQWKAQYHLDLDNLVQPLLFRIICSYLDQGIALQHFPFEDLGLLNAIRQLEQASFASFFKTERVKKLLFDEKTSITSLLDIIVGAPELYEQYLFDQQFSHRGWSGMVATIESQPESILYQKKIAFEDFIVLELLLEIDALESKLGEKWPPLSKKVPVQPLDLFAAEPMQELQEVLSLWQDAFEWSYYDEVLAGIKAVQNKEAISNTDVTRPVFQAIFCIDERECSLRRHLEHTEPHCETLAAPGFFGVEFFFQPAGGKFYEKLCPAPVTPQYLIKETEVDGHREHEILYSKKSHTFLQGLLISLSLGVWAAVRIVLDLFRPRMSPAISNAFSHMNLHGTLLIENTDPSQRENHLQIGFTLTEMADRVEGLLRGIGMVKTFSPLVYVVAHGSSSANNPHHGAHDCGACSGRPGATNARVFAFMANHPKVRQMLETRGLHIPTDTIFVGAMHDTASDEMAFYDEKGLPENVQPIHLQYKETFEHALNLNAKERSRRFASINTKADLKKVRKAIRERSVSYFEPRPELGHGSNALCYVGRRSSIKNLFFDRRAFMNSYDYRTDLDGKHLLGVMRPLPPVCGGINLEYYFSRVDNYKLGAGTKLPHNVMGLIGVANSSDGDLRPGLPLQMIEVHDPVRLLILVEHYPEVVLRTIQFSSEYYEWFSKGWVHLCAIHPDTQEIYHFAQDAFHLYHPLKGDVAMVADLHHLIESAQGMETNYIVDSTKENIPIHVIKK